MIGSKIHTFKIENYPKGKSTYASGMAGNVNWYKILGGKCVPQESNLIIFKPEFAVPMTRTFTTYTKPVSIKKAQLWPTRSFDANADYTG
jgi:hypothetical protein